MKFKIGHVLIKVKDLDKAIQQFEKMGFSVTLRSNAIIYFSDYSFIEQSSTRISIGKKIK